MKAFYDYTNKLGVRKRICLTKKEENWYFFTIWNMTNGELCSYGCETEVNLISFLADYGVKP